MKNEIMKKDRPKEGRLVSGQSFDGHTTDGKQCGAGTRGA
jgi:hypothetical protein